MQNVGEVKEAIMALTHFNEEGRAHMVDVSDKERTKRLAIATGKIYMHKKTISRIKEGLISKGDVLNVAQIAGIMGAKRTSDMIPMCHNISLTGVDIRFTISEDCVFIKATAKTTGETGVEMEALSAVSVAALTIYDMCKALDKDMVIGEIKLQEKQGGKTGHYIRT